MSLGNPALRCVSGVDEGVQGGGNGLCEGAEGEEPEAGGASRCKVFRQQGRDVVCNRKYAMMSGYGSAGGEVGMICDVVVQ